MKRFVLVAVVLYIVAVLTLVGVAADPAGLVSPVPGYRLAVFWAMPETSANRLSALIAAGREAESVVYAAVVGLSATLLGVLAAAGVGFALALRPATPCLPRREAVLILILLAFLVGTAGPLAAFARDLEAAGLAVSAGLNAMPGYWIGTTLVSCAVFARYAMLLAHDATLILRAGLRAAYRGGGGGHGECGPLRIAPDPPSR